MKLKITPNTHTVRTVLQERLDSEQKLLDEDGTKLAQLSDQDQGGMPLLYNPMREREVLDLKRMSERRQNAIQQWKTELSLLDSHSAPKVLVEIEI